MTRRLPAVVLVLCCLLAITGSAQDQGQPGPKPHGVILQISIVETIGVQQNDLARIETSKDELNRVIADGRARLIGFLQVRTRTGEHFKARLGERVPIQTATLPAFRPTGRSSREASEPLQSQVGVPQVAYENTGLIVEGGSTTAGDGLIDIRLTIDMTGLDHSTGRLTPTFTQRTLTDVVRMRENETVMLMGFVQPAGRKLSIEEIASGISSPLRGGFVVLLTTKLVR